MRRRSYITELTARATEAALAADVVDSGQPLTPAAEVEREYQPAVTTQEPPRQMGIVATQREYATKALEDLRRQKRECEERIAASETQRDTVIAEAEAQVLKMLTEARVKHQAAVAAAEEELADTSAKALAFRTEAVAMNETRHYETARAERARLREITAGTEGLQLLLGRLRQTE